MHGQKAQNDLEVLLPNRFGRLFPNLQPFRPSDKSLEDLGKAMVENSTEKVSDIPAGYTYLGQFIDHDISKDSLGATDPRTISTIELSQLIQERTPSLDLDSLYGSGETESIVAWDSNDLAKFRLGNTIPDDQVPRSFQNDLPRKLDGTNPAKALIGDPRNDENLVVAQIHVAFLKFHNAVVDVVRSRNLNPELDAITVRNQAKEIVILHYQSIVLHDFIKRFVNEEVYERVIKNNNPQFFKIVASEMPFMPIEFSGAAYRWHTLIRDSYNWNKVFNSVNPPFPTGTLQLLFQFSGLQNNDEFVGFRNERKKSLSSNWIVDWTRLFDFTQRGVAKGEGFNLTEPIDTLLVQTLHRFGPPNAPMNLAIKNLVRGSRIGLPSAQDIASAMGITPLTPEELLQNSQQEKVLSEWELHIKTPLWYYVNREAEVLGNSSRFGPLASTIICETFHGLAKGSRRSILDPENKGWKPDTDLLPSNENFYSFTDLLWFVKESSDSVDELNPIG